MRKTIKMPRILKINWTDDLFISVVFNNGESRVIDFEKLLDKLNLRKDSPARALYSKDEFAKATIKNNTLSWDNVEQYISMKDGSKIRAPFQVGPDVLLQYSEPEFPGKAANIGERIRSARTSLGLTSGTSRTYISRLENDKSDIELGTLRKIIETGLGKKLEIRIL
jgi:hypothetical protein